ncbi:MAG: tetratricopeptide repeat protein, partial [Bacteroidales bacterium]
MKAITFSAFFLIVLYSSNVFSESYKVKKLKIEISKAVLVDKKLDLLIEIANEIKGSYPDSALYYLRQAEIFTPELKTNNEREIINIKILLCRISVEVAKGNYSESWKLDSLALLKAKSISNRELEGQALMSKGGILYHLSEFDKAQEINREALRLIKTTNDRKTEGKILTNMGTIEFILGYADKADSLFRIPMKLAEEAGDEDLLAASLLNIGLLNIYRGEYKVAEDNLLKSIEVYKSIDGKDGLVLCYQSLSTIYFEQGNMEKSIEFNVMNFNLSMELGDRIG